MIAPIEKINDFSTAQMMKNQGTTLSIEKLSALNSQEEVIIAVLKQANLVDFERVLRIFAEVLKSKKFIEDEESLEKLEKMLIKLVLHFALVNKDGMLICRSEVRYEKVQMRLSALRNFIILKLQKNEHSTI
mmetsp:Transcript_6090/g.4604  ORF Transcript_6090/g.4604 Transcript_6090/m.4604 type:complete len:132 (-) Transcript_6090:263-658(-)|eukprot:CAMPEP_0202963292 /NCGR_PEP_ID=MMETSP1396-20130829/7277_1 /ASSEMBLY_ACC=CAM_ASM_000872 /TAXON_ID= /ORGANISM="Pseudokeronopsis sp., Strain Brazil" /LENGTH=131 /DNA_ID=CAMNT_0049684375 /DNA_START=635 /DNA_END=1030 /DNA_ORIENTATION=-